jgi:hypothetical protein
LQYAKARKDKTRRRLLAQNEHGQRPPKQQGKKNRRADEPEMMQELAHENAPVIPKFPGERKVIEIACRGHQEEAHAKCCPNAGAGEKTEASSLHGIDDREDRDACQGPKRRTKRRARGGRPRLHQNRREATGAREASPKN